MIFFSFLSRPWHRVGYKIHAQRTAEEWTHRVPHVVFHPRSPLISYLQVFRKLFFQDLLLKQELTWPLKTAASLSSWRKRVTLAPSQISREKHPVAFRAIKTVSQNHRFIRKRWDTARVPEIYQFTERTPSHLLLPSKLVIQILLSSTILNGDILRKWDAKVISIYFKLSRHLYPTISLRLTLRPSLGINILQGVLLLSQNSRRWSG